MQALYTNGGDLRYENGDIYVGYYYISDDGNPMSGTTTNNSERLYYINSNTNNYNFSADISIQKFNKQNFKKRVDTSFSELLNTDEESNIFNSLADDNTIELSNFFDLYNKLFYDIPKTGQINSHESLIKQSSEYVNFTPNQDIINSLQEEISSLREQLLQEQENNIQLLNNTNT